MTQRRQYRVNAATVDEINFQLFQLADRLDQMEGYRGTPLFKSAVDMGGNKATNSGAATDQTDLTPLQQVTDILTLNKPIGTIHPTINPANPATYLGYGTWVAFGAGRVLVGVDPSDPDFDTVAETGGAKTAAVAAHTHSTPAHVHPAGTSVTGITGAAVNDASGGGGTTGSGGSTNVSTVQPYITIYMFLRTA